MVLDMVTGKVWTPDAKTARDFYNLGRWVDDTQGGVRPESTTQAEREGEFDRLVAEGEDAKALVEKFIGWWKLIETTDGYMDFADDVGRELDAYRGRHDRA